MPATARVSKHLRLPEPLARALEAAASRAGMSETQMIIDALQAHPEIAGELAAQIGQTAKEE